MYTTFLKIVENKQLYLNIKDFEKFGIDWFNNVFSFYVEKFQNYVVCLYKLVFETLLLGRNIYSLSC